MTVSEFATCAGCPSPISCNVRYECIRVCKDCDRLRAELSAANDSLIAARGQISALVAEQREADADSKRGLQQYLTTKQFHQQQADMAPSRGVSIPAAELAVTEEEDEAFTELARRMDRMESASMLQMGRINTLADKLDAIREAL